MLYDAKTPEEYLNSLEPDWRKEKLEQVRSLIKKIAPELEEGIEYKMLCYRENDKTIFHLNAQKSYVSLYVCDIEKVEGARVLLKDFDFGKGCIRIKKSLKLPDTSLAEFIERVIGKWRKGENTDC